MTKTRLIIATLILLAGAPALAQTPVTNVFGLDFRANNTQPLCSANQGCIRYNSGTQQFEHSDNGGAYTAFASTLQQAYTAGGSGGGAITTTAAGGPIALTAAAIGAGGFTFKEFSNAQTANPFEIFNSLGTSLFSLQPEDAGASIGVFITSQLNGGTRFLTSTNASGTIVFQNAGSNILQTLEDRVDFIEHTGSTVYLQAGSGFGSITNRLSVFTAQSVAFSATPAFDCTVSDFIHFGPVTGNVTAVTMVGGLSGEHCTIVMQKDTSGSAFTVTNGWGSNTRATNSSFNSASQSTLVYKFTWDPNTATPSWVEESLPQTVP